MIDKFSSFREKLKRCTRDRRTWICIGLDPRVDRLPAHLPSDAAGVLRFSTEIIESTAAIASSFKINFAYFEALGVEGWNVLREVRRCVPDDVPVIADAKRGDIATSAEAYARAIFDELDFDAVTVSPYLGWDALEPFTCREGRGIFVLCKTSNPGGGALQDLQVDGDPLYVHVAQQALALETRADVGLVVGATYPQALQQVRRLGPETLLLVPGVGTQGGDSRAALRCAANEAGDNAVFPVSREILQASSGRDFAEAAAVVATVRARELWAGSN